MFIKKMAGEDIKALRKTLNLNQEEFARKLNIPLGSLRNWEQELSKPNQTAVSFLNVLNQLTKRKCSTQDFLYELLYEPKIQRRSK